MGKELIERRRRAYLLNAEIVYRYNHYRTAESRIRISLTLKEIKEEGYYKELGYKSFGAYVKNQCPFSRSTAYLYLKVAKLPTSFLNRFLPVDVGDVLEKLGIDPWPIIKFKKETIWQKICRKMKLSNA